ncbi:hypothetical protein B4113_0598 [Geobacillus sp. B4113_201601]|nr:hypothetical protein B4113_0598 [Geobacillus sp. B4113_201601]
MLHAPLPPIFSVPFSSSGGNQKERDAKRAPSLVYMCLLVVMS